MSNQSQDTSTARWYLRPQEEGNYFAGRRLKSSMEKYNVIRVLTKDQRATYQAEKAKFTAAFKELKNAWQGFPTEAEAKAAAAKVQAVTAIPVEVYAAWPMDVFSI